MNDAEDFPHFAFSYAPPTQGLMIFETRCTSAKSESDRKLYFDSLLSIFRPENVISPSDSSAVRLIKFNIISFLFIILLYILMYKG